MEAFTTHVVKMLKAEGLFAPQGGPIILHQIENEYGTIEAAYGEGGRSYVSWAANMAASWNTSVPLTMCKQDDAPSFVINTCNSAYCADLIRSYSKSKPKIWSESWTGWFLEFGGKYPHRPVEDLAYAVVQFIVNGGTFVNYYMYYGGTNFGRSAGPFIAPSYDYDAPIDEYGIIRQQKWGHLRYLHGAINLCKTALLYGNAQSFRLGPSQEAHVFQGNKGECAAFLTNMDPGNNSMVWFQNRRYHLPAWSVSILPDCVTVIFNTAKVGSQSGLVSTSQSMLESKGSESNANTNVYNWMSFKEEIEISGNDSFTKKRLLEQIVTTKDTTDYLWYRTSIYVHSSEPFLQNNSQPVLEVESLGHAILVFVNGILVGDAKGNKKAPAFNLQQPIKLLPGKNRIALLSMTVGLRNSGAFYERRGAGITRVTIQGFKDGTKDLSRASWKYQVGLVGEKKEIYTEDGSDRVLWASASPNLKNQPMTWYKRRIDAPEGDEPVALDLRSMGKGQAWVNGEHIGRYWLAARSPHRNCSEHCDYRGRYDKHKCHINCGQPSQSLYHVPRSFLRPLGNLLVLFEEREGDPSKISWVVRSEENICSFISEEHPITVRAWKKQKATGINAGAPKLHLKCPGAKLISSIKFASFGTPHGSCGKFVEDKCHATQSRDIVEKRCLGRTRCNVVVSVRALGSDPCPGTVKSLAVEAVCT
eukprot:TRINITY_DN15846_c0_g1_i1.p1 TRINITY_DN15846_c0_g1~~TRINITY_DN15846_c0_g1_i1.p1  ORF type:complete len:802 (+),score=93.62 TRINITY_DN15846_c0_g1_i1:301-2406(+)